MKKLEKLKLNEMQDYSLIEQREQMILKGGNANPQIVNAVVGELIDRAIDWLFGDGEEETDGSGRATIKEDNVEVTVDQTGLFNVNVTNVGSSSISEEQALDALISASDSVKVDANGNKTFYINQD